MHENTKNTILAIGSIAGLATLVLTIVRSKPVADFIAARKGQ